MFSISSPSVPHPHFTMVSVVIPARNAAATLDATLWSVRRQTYAAWEVVVVNEKFGIRLTDIVTPSERMRRVSKA